MAQQEGRRGHGLFAVWLELQNVQRPTVPAGNAQA